MALIIGIVVVMLIILICAKSKGSETQGKESAPAENQYPYDMAWPKPSRDDLWDSFDYFVRMGEVSARRSNSNFEEIVSVGLQTCDHLGQKRGAFDVKIYGDSDIESIKRRFPQIPYLQDIDQNGNGIKGFDPDSSMLTMEQSEIRRLIMREAEHADDIIFEMWTGYLSIKVKFRGIL